MSKLSLFSLAILTGGALLIGSARAQTDETSPGQAVFEVLASEIALQRGEAGLAYNTYMEMARQYKDPRLAQRAMEIGIAGGSPELALQAAKVWDSLAPASDTKPAFRPDSNGVRSEGKSENAVLMFNSRISISCNGFPRG